MQKVRDFMFLFKIGVIVLAFVVAATLVMSVTHPSAGTSAEIVIFFLIVGGFVALKEAAKYRR